LLEDPPPWLRPAYCFASVIVCLIVTLSAALVACVFRATTIKGRQLF